MVFQLATEVVDVAYNAVHGREKDVVAKFLCEVPLGLGVGASVFCQPGCMQVKSLRAWKRLLCMEDDDEQESLSQRELEEEHC